MYPPPRSADQNFGGNHQFPPENGFPHRVPRPAPHETWRPRHPSQCPPPRGPPPMWPPGPPPFRPPGPHSRPHGPRSMRPQGQGPLPNYFNSPSLDIHSYERFGSEGINPARQQNGYRMPHHNNGPPQKKKKLDSRDKAANNKFYCDTCDRGYKTEETYREHTDGHQQCHFADCTYTAAPKLVQLHIQMQHKTGLAKKIWQLESPDELQRWISERKKNYPTQENIERKRNEQREREQRGEVLHTGSWGKMKGRGRNARPFPERKHQGHIKGHTNSAVHCSSQIDSPCPATVPDSTNATEKDRNHHSSVDSLALLAHNDIKSEEIDSRKDKCGVELAGGLGSLIASYSVSSEEEESTTEHRDESSKSPPKPKQKSGPEKKKSPRNRNKNNNIVKPSVKASLLQKLLAGEIRRERNVVLQCIRYIVNNNYLQKTAQVEGEEVKEEVTKNEVKVDVVENEIVRKTGVKEAKVAKEEVRFGVTEEDKSVIEPDEGKCYLVSINTAEDGEMEEVTVRRNTLCVDEDIWEDL